jgi:hypothetical protein
MDLLDDTGLKGRGDIDGDGDSDVDIEDMIYRYTTLSLLNL